MVIIAGFYYLLFLEKKQYGRDFKNTSLLAYFNLLSFRPNPMPVVW